MKIPLRPPPGTVSQFLHGTTGQLVACVIVAYDGEHGLKIRYFHPVDKVVVDEAFIHVTDLVSDEDAATHDFE